MLVLTESAVIIAALFVLLDHSPEGRRIRQWWFCKKIWIRVRYAYIRRKGTEWLNSITEIVWKSSRH